MAVCFQCYKPIEQARINILGPSVQTCAACAFRANSALSLPKTTTTSYNVEKVTPPKKAVPRRLLQCVLFEGDQKRVSAPTVVIHQKLTMNVLFEGDIWGTLVRV